VSSMHHVDDEDGVGAMHHEMSNMLQNNNMDHPGDHAEPPTTPTVEKSVRIAEGMEVTEVDLLIFMPDKYDDVWLDEWSDIVSRASKTQVNVV